jgi:hypothetical protein
VQDGNRILVARNQNMQTQIYFELLDPRQRNVWNLIVVETQVLQRFYIVLHQNAFPLCLS